MEEKQIEPIAIIATDYKEKFGIPRQSGRVKTAKGVIKFLPPYNDPAAIKGISGFSHIWLIFGFSANEYKEFSPTVRPPRLGGNTRMGVFATRSPFRPNGLGLSCVKLDGITENGELSVSGADLLDGTPIYDIKSYLPYADCIPDALGGFTDEKKRHRLRIKDGAEILNIIPKDKVDTVIDCICDDPRPSYQNDKNRVYSIRFANYDIHFTVDGQDVSIKSVDIEIKS